MQRQSLEEGCYFGVSKNWCHVHPEVSALVGSLDGVDSSGDETIITTIPTVSIYSSSDKTTTATFPAFQDDLLSASPLDTHPRIRVNAVGTNI